MSELNTKKRADQMQFLRFISFLLIFLWHCDTYIPNWFPRGEGAGIAVSFFVVLSGAVTAYSCFPKDTIFSLCSAKDRLMRKIKKVYPLYLITTLYMVICSQLPSLIANEVYRSAIPDFWQLLKNLLLIQSWFPSGYFSFNGVGWFLSMIIFLYALENPILSVASKIKNREKSVLIFAVIAIISSLSTVLYCFLTRNSNIEFTQYILPVSRLGEFIIGICIGYIVRLTADKISDFNINKLFFTGAELLVLVFWFASMYIKPQTIWVQRSVQWLIPNSLLVCIFLYGKGYISRLLSLKLFVNLGDISFECFLIHQIIIFEYSTHASVGAISRVGSVFSVGFCLLFTLLLAWFFHIKKSRNTTSINYKI